MRGQYSRKAAPRTMSPEMDRWECEQQKKHTREKRIRRDVRTLIREVRDSQKTELTAAKRSVE